MTPTWRSPSFQSSYQPSYQQARQLPYRVVPAHEWRKSTFKDDDRYYLWKGGKQIGGWDMKGEYYRALKEDGQWGEKGVLPRGVPLLPMEVRVSVEQWKEDWRTHGVIPHKNDCIGNDCDYSINGQKVTKDDALAQLKLEDDSGKMWLVLIGPESSRKRVEDDLDSNPSLTSLKGRVRIWSVDKDHFSLMDRDTKEPMFENKGDPSIHLMAPDGQLYGSMKNHDPEALRKIDPEWKRKPILPILPQVPDFDNIIKEVKIMLIWVGIGAFALVILIIVTRKDK